MDAYTIRLHPAEEGGYWVSCDELPGTVSQGSDVGDALVMMGEAMVLALGDDDTTVIPPDKVEHTTHSLYPQEDGAA